ncbi:MAG: aminoglycoside phosphotransferase family protein [Patescibacteria group bacterium]|nr:aminoglycoside phosphotransferase family protein [Patescibacteria group bacterium]
MNKILKLKEEGFVKDLFRKEVLPLYPDFKDIKGIKQIWHKKNIWEDTYHVVVEFRTAFFTHENKIKILPIFCSAHSDEPRKNVFEALKFLWKNDFGRGYLSIPHALFYSNYFQATFYRGAPGRNLYQYIREKNLAEVEDIVPKAAAWFAKLHNLSILNAKNFNQENSRIETVLPGIEHILYRIKDEYPEYYDVYEEAYELVDNSEKEFFSSIDKRWLVHGDAHPENVIKMSPRKIAVIDFTDLCLSDFTRDIGAFTQQLNFMIMRKIKDLKYADKIKKLFVGSYFNKSKEKLTKDVQKRIDNYYYWTAMRTATYFLIKDKPQPNRAHSVICQVCRGLDIKTDYRGVCERY